MSQADIIKKQAEQILILQKRVAKLETTLRNLGQNPGATIFKENEKQKEKNQKREKLPGWVRHLTD